MLNSENLDIVYVTGEFNDEMREAVLNKVFAIRKKKDVLARKEVQFNISSIGGASWVLQDILHEVYSMQKAGYIVKTHVSSHAFSCGSLLAVAGSSGHRTMSAFAEHLVHYGSGTSTSYSPIELQRDAERLQRHFDFVEGVYRKHCKIPNLKKLIETDGLFITAEQALEWRMVDEIV